MRSAGSEPLPPRFRIGRLAICGLLGLGSVAVVAPAARAQITVFDPSNYSQNLLTAARTLQQVNNQIRSLQNEAQMLVNQAKNLSRAEFPELARLTDTLREIDRLMGQAQGIDFRLGSLDEQFRAIFPEQFDSALNRDQLVQTAKARLAAAMASFRQTMSVQSQVVANLSADRDTLAAITARSNGAEGALQAQQGTNQLLALLAKQQLQIQTMLAAQFRATATDAARKVESEVEARGRTRKFLGSGNAYPPH